jgi:hypothetical protein
VLTIRGRGAAVRDNCQDVGMNDDYWATVTVPVLNAVGELEEEEGADITYAALAERSGVEQKQVELLVLRLTRDGDRKQWIDGAYTFSGFNGLVSVRLAGLGPKGMAAVRGQPGQEAIAATLERLAAGATGEEQQMLRGAAGFVSAAPAAAFWAAAMEFARIKLGLP